MAGLAAIQFTGHCTALREKAGKQPMDTILETGTWKVPGAHSGEVICWSQSTSQRDSIQKETPQGTKELAPGPFVSPATQHKHRATCGNQQCTHTYYLTCLNQAPQPRHSSGTNSPSHICLSPSTAGPFPRRLAQTLANAAFPNLGVLGSRSSGRSGNRSHFTNRPEHG